MNILELMRQCDGFQWDEGNFLKSWEKHGVSPAESEQIFFNRPLVALHDEKHSATEERLFALGHTDLGRLLFVVFTVRENLIRVISARDMNSKEKKIYRK